MKLTRKGKRVFIYVRVSTQEQARDGYSIDEQIERLKEYCKAMGWVVVKIYTDAGHSGATTARPALQDMIKDIEGNKGDIVAVYKLDRLSRSQKDTLKLIEDIFLANNVDFVSMNENFDTSTPFGRAMIGILAVFAQLEREQIKERMSMGKEGRAKEGKWQGGGKLPVGYNYIDGKLVIDEYEKMQIVEMFELFNQGVSTGQIAKLFHEKGYKNKHGAWSDKRVRMTLKNKLYIGYVEFNGNHYKGIHTAIIDDDSFNKAQTIFKSRSQRYSKNGTGQRKSTYLGSLLYCKKCTARYIGYGTKDYKYYSCHSRRKQNLVMVKDPNCKNKTYKMSVLDNKVFEEIRKLALDPDYIQEIKESNYSDEEINKETILRKEIEKIDTQRKRIMDLYKIAEYTIDEVQNEVAPLNEQKKKIENELINLTADKSTMTKEEVIEIVKDFGDIMDRGIYDEIRLMIETLIDHIDIKEDEIFIHWKFA